MVDFYTEQLEICWSNPAMSSLKTSARVELVKQLVNRDPKNFSWTGNTFDYIASNRHIDVDEALIRPSTYRPFTRNFINFDPNLNHSRYKQPRLFPQPDSENLLICVSFKASRDPFSALMCREVTSRTLFGVDPAACYPRYVYFTNSGDSRESNASLFDSPTESRRHGVTDSALARVRSLLNAEISKDDLFFYVYGILHSSEYRETFAADFTKDVPRIPYVEDPTDFYSLASAGRALSELHLDYESVDPWPDIEVKFSPSFDAESPESYRVTKMEYAKSGRETDRTTIKYNSNITISNIPLEAHEYTVGARSAIDWVVQRYQVKPDKDSGIVNDPNDWAAEHDDPTYIFDLVRRIVTVSMQTNEIVASLPSLNL
jgi:predicted helicase